MQILQDEHLRLAVALDALAACGIHRRQLHSLRTDAIIVHSTRKQAKEGKEAIAKIERATLFDGYRGVQKSGGEGLVFRTFSCKAPAVHADSSILHCDRPRPHVLPPQNVWVEGACDIEELALHLAGEKRGMLIYGPPGCGKSYLLKRILETVDSAVTVARTHVASSQFEHGLTLSRLKHQIQHGKFSNPLICDEAFMVEEALLRTLCRISFTNEFIILSGDDAQLEPINDTHHGQKVPPLLGSDLLYCLAPIRLELNVCKRSDTGLHDFGLLCRSGSFDECLCQARAVFDCKHQPDIWLTVDNARRQQINEYVNRALAPEDATKLEAVDGTILLYEGANLIATKTIYGVTNAIW